ncbi:MAG TPA: ABC transporter permease, partial [Vicinamibacterales bacterium]|nr:ABC transporter permease [Vicinamibacterales bacterium]
MIPGDVRHAWRSIVRMPVVATVVVVSLGVGIGVNTAVFSWVQAMYLQPLPGVAGAGRMYLVEPRSDTGSYPGTSWLEYLDVKQRLTSLPDLFAYRMVAFNVGERGRVERTYGQFVSGNYFSALGLSPALGRFLRPDEAATAGGEPVAVVSYDYWQTRFNGSPEVLGRTIRVNELPLTVIGVAPRGFQGTVLMLKFDLWAPATLAPTLLAGSRELDDRSLRGYSVVGSLARSSTPAQSQAELDRTMSELANTYPETNANVRGEVLSFWDAPRGPQRMLGTALLMLQGLMLLLLLAVCG